MVKEKGETKMKNKNDNIKNIYQKFKASKKLVAAAVIALPLVFSISGCAKGKDDILCLIDLTDELENDAKLLTMDESGEINLETEEKNKLLAILDKNQTKENDLYEVFIINDAGKIFHGKMQEKYLDNKSIDEIEIDKDTVSKVSKILFDTNLSTKDDNSNENNLKSESFVITNFSETKNIDSNENKIIYIENNQFKTGTIDSSDLYVLDDNNNNSAVEKYIVNVEGLNLRKEASVQSECVDKLKIGTEVLVLGHDNETSDAPMEWCNIAVNIDGKIKRGYVCKNLYDGGKKIKYLLTPEEYNEQINSQKELIEHVIEQEQKETEQTNQKTKEQVSNVQNNTDEINFDSRIFYISSSKILENNFTELKEEASTFSRTVETLDDNTIVYIKANENSKYDSWIKVHTLNDKIGYVSSDCIFDKETGQALSSYIKNNYFSNESSEKVSSQNVNQSTRELESQETKESDNQEESEETKKSNLRIYYVNGAISSGDGRVNIRKLADSQSELVATLDKDTQIYIDYTETLDNDGWLKISGIKNSDGQDEAISGYVSSNFVFNKETEKTVREFVEENEIDENNFVHKAGLKKFYVDGSIDYESEIVNVRKDATVNSERVLTINNGTQVYIDYTAPLDNNGWTKICGIKTKDGNFEKVAGYISSNFIYEYDGENSIMDYVKNNELENKNINSESENVEAPYGDYKIIDISEHNGTIDFKKLKENGYNQILIRMFDTFFMSDYSEDSMNKVDLKFEEYIEECKKYDIDYGFYIYSRATTEKMAKLEAIKVLYLLNKYDLRPTLPIYWDIESQESEPLYSEEDGIINKNEKYNSLDFINYYPEQVINNFYAFAEILENSNYKVGIYSGDNVLNTIDPEGDKLIGYSVWNASYCYGETQCDYDVNYKTNNLKYAGDTAIFQFSDTGRIEGINGNVDCNYGKYDYTKEIKENNMNYPISFDEIKSKQEEILSGTANYR